MGGWVGDWEADCNVGGVCAACSAWCIAVGAAGTCCGIVARPRRAAGSIIGRSHPARLEPGALLYRRCVGVLMHHAEHCTVHAAPRCAGRRTLSPSITRWRTWRGRRAPGGALSRHTLRSSRWGPLLGLGGREAKRACAGTLTRVRGLRFRSGHCSQLVMSHACTCHCCLSCGHLHAAPDACTRSPA